MIYFLAMPPVFEPANVRIIIPAFNEAGVIGRVIGELCEGGWQVILVDDGSHDGTIKAASDYPVTILHHAANLGQGAALQTGLRYAMQRTDAAAMVTFDADGQHDPADLPRLLGALAQGGDVALGTRFSQGGAALDMPLPKRLTLRLAILVTRAMTGLPLTDTHNGLRAFTRSAAARLHIRHNGMAHASEILNQVASLKLHWIEVPVTIRYTEYSRRKGQSIFNSLNILWEILMGKMR